MKTEMKMLPNGNYESVVSPIQHQCVDGAIFCTEYGWDIGKLQLEIEAGDPYEDGFGHKQEVNFCPICGYKPKCRKHEWGSEEYAADGKPYYKCNKCGDEKDLTK